MNVKICYLMRGLPSCGKSHTARKLAGREGVVSETDQYFYTQVGNDPARYDYDSELLDEARRWNFERFSQAVRHGSSPVVVDRGNSLNLESHVYARYAADHGYRVELKEPESAWWQEIRVLLKYKPVTLPILSGWARKLADANRGTQRVPVSTIQHWIEQWKWDLTIEEILNYTPHPSEDDSLFREFLTSFSAATNVDVDREGISA